WKSTSSAKDRRCLPNTFLPRKAADGEGYDPVVSRSETGPVLAQEIPTRFFCPTRSKAVQTSRETLERMEQPPAAYDCSQLRGPPPHAFCARRRTWRPSRMASLRSSQISPEECP